MLHNGRGVLLKSKQPSFLTSNPAALCRHTSYSAHQRLAYCSRGSVARNSGRTEEDIQCKNEEDEDADVEFDALEGHYGNRYFKLIPLDNGEATIEIDGVKMHITATKAPSEDARDKVKLARVRKNAIVLDVCTGLGYSAMACVRAGAKEVYTLEKEDAVLEVARQNPLSAELFTMPQIRIVKGDAYENVKRFEDEFFSSVLHDPPRLSHAGELYSLTFYQQLARVLKSGGRLFHYTGSPRGVSGKSIPKGVKERLMKAGFTDVKWQDSCQGFSATRGM